jgi:outer membrane protein OmpA-like peptidoglycan-associated protein
MGFDSQAGFDMSGTFGTSGDTGEAAAEPAGDGTDPWENREFRKLWVYEQNGISAATGLLRVSQAGSGAPGTFRLSLLGSWYSGSDFLCSEATPCPALYGEDPATGDEVDRMGAHLGLSVTVLPYLEIFGALHNLATYDSRGRPRLLQVLGDSNLGVKAFWPWEPEQLFSFGGQAEVHLKNGTGGVGLDGGGTSFALRALGSLDLGNTLKPEDRIPVRGHLNVGYVFDNTAKLVRAIETSEPPTGRGERISRIERYGLDINRVDSFEIGVGAEYVHEFIRPFAEFTVDIPVNRQNYVCNVNNAADAGDRCLGEYASFATTPSRVTLGARVLPWPNQGLSITLAADIGTGATSQFIEEVAPETPWNLHFGLAYAIDTVPPPPVVERVEVVKEVAAPVPVAPPRYYISGVVVDKANQEPVPGAILRFEGRDLTGLVANEQGRFVSADLEPGQYVFRVSASGYKEGQCMASVFPARPAATPQPTAPMSPYGAVQPGAQPGAPGAQPGALAGPEGGATDVRCELTALPKVGNIVGVLVDGDSGAPIANASVKITDRLGRELELSADSAGAFRFENVPPGPAKVTATARGYLTAVAEFEVKARDDIKARIMLNAKPDQPNVVVTNRELKLKRQVHFQHDSDAILPDSHSILEEIAEVLRSRDDIQLVEVQGHTDNKGAADYNLRLSQRRAQAVVAALVRLGIEASRFEAKGYGQERPLMPNTSEANRSRNRRVQLMIKERGK